MLRTLDGDGRIKPLKLSHYQSVVGTAEEPYIRLIFTHRKHHFQFRVEFRAGQYHTRIDRSAIDAFPEIHALLCAAGGFVESEFLLSKMSAPAAITDSLIELAGLLATIHEEAASVSPVN